mmetsp:Transcript_115024/g.245674  ORF Transcript_115024/g.245674 Transcript_115024/m.245674 type:complete len:312 (+) Transcript_115024:73-1008(+)
MNAHRILFATLASMVVLSRAEFCASHLFTNDILCDDGSVLPTNGCCADNSFCPSSCQSGSMSNGVCTCTGCAKARAITLTAEEQWVKAHNYFRCRHGHNDVAWDSTVATNAAIPATSSCNSGSLGHSDSYNMNPPAGENLAMGQNSPENAVEAWYSEITTAAGGLGYIPGTTPSDSRYNGGSNAVGHYTALIWKSTTKIGCSTCTSGSSPVWACQYAESPPNFGGLSEYETNVPQSNAATATAETCCNQVYGAASPSPSPSVSPSPAPSPAPAPSPSPASPSPSAVNVSKASSLRRPYLVVITLLLYRALL